MASHNDYTILGSDMERVKGKGGGKWLTLPRSNLAFTKLSPAYNFSSFFYIYFLFEKKIHYNNIFSIGQQLCSASSGRLKPRARRGKVLTQFYPDLARVNNVISYVCVQRV